MVCLARGALHWQYAFRSQLPGAIIRTQSSGRRRLKLVVPVLPAATIPSGNHPDPTMAWPLRPSLHSAASLTAPAAVVTLLLSLMIDYWHPASGQTYAVERVQ